MSDTETQLEWENTAQDKFNNVIKRIPLFHRDIAYKVVFKKAEINARQRGASQVEESDIVRAFFSEVPMTFYSLMIRLLDGAGFNYKEWESK